MPASVSQTSLQIATPAGSHGTDWSLIDEELTTVLRPLHSELAIGIVSPSTAAEEFVSPVTAHLDYHCALKKLTTLLVPLFLPTYTITNVL